MVVSPRAGHGGDESDLCTLAGQPLREEPKYRSHLGYMVFIVGEDKDSMRRIAVSFDRPVGHVDPDMAWVDRNSDDLLEHSELVTGAANRDINGEVLFELGALDKKIEEVRVTLSGDQRDEIKVSGRWGEKRHFFFSERLVGESGRPATLSKVLSRAPIYRIGGPLKLEYAGSMPLKPDTALTPGSTYEVHTLLGWPGVGEGTFTSLACSVVPATTDPFLKVRIPRSSGSKEESVPLSQRRAPNEFRGRLEIPRDARPGEQVTITPAVKLPENSVTGPMLRFKLVPREDEKKDSEKKDSEKKDSEKKDSEKKDVEKKDGGHD
jgi:hypothetical protein